MASAQNIRIVSYNILDGGMGRLDPIYETLLYLSGHIVGLTDANDPEGTAYLANKLSMEHLSSGSADGRSHVALLSRGPIQKAIHLSATLKDLTGAACLAECQMDDGKPLRVVLVQLPEGFGPEAESRRLKDLKTIFEHLPESSMPTCLIGDMNIAAPYHPIEIDAASAPIQKAVASSQEAVCHDVVHWLVDHLWFDVLENNPQHTYSTGFPATRTDYIWLDPALRQTMINAGVETGGFAPYCSDHYPIWATLNRTHSP